MSYKDFPEGINLGNGVILREQAGGLVSNSPLLFANSGISQTSDLTIRTRVSLAEMNAGKTLSVGKPPAAFRLVDVKCISIGGSVAATADATGYAIYGTQAGAAVALFEVLLAAGAQSAVCQPGTANTNVLADGASFAACDAGGGLTCKAVSAGAFDLITAQFFDVILTLAVEV